MAGINFPRRSNIYGKSNNENSVSRLYHESEEFFKNQRLLNTCSKTPPITLCTIEQSIAPNINNDKKKYVQYLLPKIQETRIW